MRLYISEENPPQLSNTTQVRASHAPGDALPGINGHEMAAFLLEKEVTITSPPPLLHGPLNALAEGRKAGRACAVSVDFPYDAATFNADGMTIDGNAITAAAYHN